MAAAGRVVMPEPDHVDRIVTSNNARKLLKTDRTSRKRRLDTAGVTHYSVDLSLSHYLISALPVSAIHRWLGLVF